MLSAQRAWHLSSYAFPAVYVLANKAYAEYHASASKASVKRVLVYLNPRRRGEDTSTNIPLCCSVVTQEKIRKSGCVEIAGLASTLKSPNGVHAVPVNMKQYDHDGNYSSILTNILKGRQIQDAKGLSVQFSSVQAKAVRVLSMCVRIPAQGKWSFHYAFFTTDKKGLAHLGSAEQPPLLLRPSAATQKVYVGPLSSQTTQAELTQHFAGMGSILSVEMKPKFAFITFADPTQAAGAIHARNGKDFRGQTLIVDYARRSAVSFSNLPVLATGLVEMPDIALVCDAVNLRSHFFDKNTAPTAWQALKCSRLNTLLFCPAEGELFERLLCGLQQADAKRVREYAARHCPELAARSGRRGLQVHKHGPKPLVWQLMKNGGVEVYAHGRRSSSSSTPVCSSSNRFAALETLAEWAGAPLPSVCNPAALEPAQESMEMEVEAVDPPLLCSGLEPSAPQPRSGLATHPTESPALFAAPSGHSLGATALAPGPKSLADGQQTPELRGCIERLQRQAQAETKCDAKTPVPPSSFFTLEASVFTARNPELQNVLKGPMRVLHEQTQLALGCHRAFQVELQPKLAQEALKAVGLQCKDSDALVNAFSTLLPRMLKNQELGQGERVALATVLGDVDSRSPRVWLRRWVHTFLAQNFHPWFLLPRASENYQKWAERLEGLQAILAADELPDPDKKFSVTFTLTPSEVCVLLSATCRNVHRSFVLCRAPLLSLC